jgi:hypothetical protein
MRLPFISTVAIVAVTLMPLSAAALNVFTCEPEWSALVSELGETRYRPTRPPPLSRIRTASRRVRA